MPTFILKWWYHKEEQNWLKKKEQYAKTAVEGITDVEDNYHGQHPRYKPPLVMCCQLVMWISMLKRANTSSFFFLLTRKDIDRGKTFKTFPSIILAHSHWYVNLRAFFCTRHRRPYILYCLMKLEWKLSITIFIYFKINSA